MIKVNANADPQGFYGQFSLWPKIQTPNIYAKLIQFHVFHLKSITILIVQQKVTSFFFAKNTVHKYI